MSLRQFFSDRRAAALVATGAVALLSVTTLPVAAADGTCPAAMAEPVEERLLPVLQALNHARHQRGVWSPDDAAAFRTLLGAADAASAEARVALMDYYVGEGPAEALTCAVALDGERSASLLARYTACDIAPQRLPLPRDHAAPLRGRATAMMAAGDVSARCPSK